MEFPGPTILMCLPDFYGIEYEINPWMSRQRQSDRQAAIQQWTSLKQLLEAGLVSCLKSGKHRIYQLNGVGLISKFENIVNLAKLAVSHCCPLNIPSVCNKKEKKK